MDPLAKAEIDTLRYDAEELSNPFQTERFNNRLSGKSVELSQDRATRRECKAKRKEQHASGVVATILYIVIAGLILVITLTRYHSDGYYWTIIFILVVWYITGAFIVGSLWGGGNEILAAFVAFLFIALSILLIERTLERRRNRLREALIYLYRNPRVRQEVAQRRSFDTSNTPGVMGAANRILGMFSYPN